MPLSSAIRRRCRDFLEPGERIRFVFPATSAAVSGAPGMVPFIIVVSDRWITALGCGMLRRYRPTSLWARYPRTVRLGPLDLRLHVQQARHQRDVLGVLPGRLDGHRVTTARPGPWR